MKRLALLGSTGSIGRQTLDVVRALPERCGVVALAAGGNTELFLDQVREFRPKLVSLHSLDAENKLKESLPDLSHLSMEDIASHPDIDLVVVATSGKAGLASTLAAVRSGKSVALANKEVLVMAGELVTSGAERRGVEIMPIDSEHSAIWQCLRGEVRDSVADLILTASGGPFRSRPLEELAAITPEEALRHPTWQMGKKVTIDSATLMNKGFEAIEARWLFNVPFSRIRVVIHPQSIVHSLVRFIDGSVKAQLSLPDMRLPIQYALSYPERWQNDNLPLLDVEKASSLTFEGIDLERFPCLRLALEAGRRGGTYPAVLSAADEVAVDLFLSRQIGFRDIATLVERVLMQHEGVSHPSLENILAADAWARESARNWSSS